MNLFILHSLSQKQENLILTPTPAVMFPPPAPGVVFNPSDREIVSHFLPKLMTGEGMGELSYLIESCDLYCIKPAALFDGNKGFLPFVKPNQRFVFTNRQKISQKNANGKRPRRVLDSRAVGDGGFWRSSTGEKPILDEQGEHVIGYVNTLNFYEYKGEKRSSKDATKTSWLMHEYRLPGENFQEWVICKVKDTACSEEDKCEAFWVNKLFGNRLLGNKECPSSAWMQEAVFNGKLPLPKDGILSNKSFKVRSVAAPAEDVAGFEDMVSGTKRKHYMLSGKGGVGNCAASLAVKFANNGHHTLVVSTDPAHSLSDSFAQDLTGKTLVPVEGPDFPLFALELGELKLGELLDTPPPGLDEAIVISEVMQFLESPQYSMFTRIVFNIGPSGHTLQLLSLPDFLDASIGKILKADKLELLRERMVKVRDLFRDSDSTEFVIVTIPTVMAVSESSRLRASLEKENVPVRRLIVDQILPPSASDCKFCAVKRKDQMRALDKIRNDPELSSLKLIQAPLVDMEIRGVPALKIMGDIVWK